MKKLLLLSLFALTFTYAKENITFKYSPADTKREHPSNQKYILSYNNVLEDVRTCIVNISVKKTEKASEAYQNPYMNDPFFREFFRGQRDAPDRVQQMLGSGVIITENGYIVTNNHVVDGADSISVNIAGDKRKYDAQVIGRDEKSDLAIIKINAKNLNAVTFYDSDKVKVGDVVFALGNPFGVGETITQGIVSATGRSDVGIVEYEDFIQTDASINPGNSGGALINSAGYLIGINSAIVSRSGGNVGIGFAIPSNMVTTIASGLINDGKYSRAYLGVSTSDVSENMSSFYNNSLGALITSVEENTPASRAGLKRGDLITSVNNKKIESANDLKNSIGAYAPSSVVEIEYLRNKKRNTIKIALESLEKKVIEDELQYAGMRVAEISPSQSSGANKGVLITEVERNSGADMIGIKRGDIIIQIENSEINSLNDFKRATASKNKKRFFIYRSGLIFAVVL